MTQPLCAIVGAGPLNGLALARRFAAGGYQPLLCSRGGAGVRSLVQALEAEGIEPRTLVIDAGDPAALAEALGAVAGIEVMIYNAYAMSQVMPSALAPSRLADELTVNVVSALAAAQAVLPGLKSAGRGTILLTGGGLALQPMAILAGLAIGKAAIRNLAFSLAEELRPAGIRVGTVTICGQIAAGTAFEPATIADRFWALHDDRDYALGVESVFDGR